MITPVLPIAVLFAASAAVPPQAAVINAVVPTSHILMQVISTQDGSKSVSKSADGRTVTSSNGNTVVTSNGKTVVTANGKTVVTSNGKTVISSNGSAGTDTLFAGSEKFAQGASESTEINLDPDSMEMVGSKHKNGELAKKMKTMTIRSYTYEKTGMYKMEDVEVFRKKLNDGTWKCSVRVRDKDESTDICSRLGADHETREMVIITAEPKEITFIHMTGQMSLDELNKASGFHGH